MTSLPPSDALFHMSAKVFQRSQGRSAVAAAAYRSGSRLHDDRIDQTFDYRNKPVVESFIMAPEGAPKWVQDRQELWNRVERAEKRRDAQVARELEISIPRDIPREQWRSFAEAVAAPYVAAGAIVDISIHCPEDAYGEPQPHIHGMIAPRALDASTETGFAAKRNAAVNSILTSGGSHGGGKRGDALRIERERVAGIMNKFLEAAGSPRRASHMSNRARGLDREPEPTMGESRLHAVKGRKRHDRQTAYVSALRNAWKAENELNILEENL